MRVTRVKWIVIRVLKCLLCILIGKNWIVMRKIDMIVIHCTATRADSPLSPAELTRMHRKGDSSVAGIIIMCAGTAKSVA